MWEERKGRVKMYWGSYWYVQSCRMVDMCWFILVLHVIITCSVEVSCCWRSLTFLSILET